MNTAGIVAEFNPFHNGHALLIEKTREAGFSHVAVVMSGNYTQRGEAACLGKAARVRAALLCGADLVLELPLPWAAASAERFASGAVGLLTALGCVDALSFGSESGDLALIEKCATKLSELDGSEELALSLATGSSFPKARAEALGGELAALLKGPNDTLAVEYVKAINRLSSPLRPYAVRRVGAAHDAVTETRSEKPEVSGQTGERPTASASALRKMLISPRPETAFPFMPKKAAEAVAAELEARRAPFQESLAVPLMLAQLRRMDAEDFLRLPDVTEGLENRILRAVRSACSLEEFYFAVKSKRYTLSRIRRIALCAYLGVDRSLCAASPPYLRVLGMNPRGREILRAAKKLAALPIVGRHAGFMRLSDFSKKIYFLECRATDLYGLCLPKIQPCGLEQKFETVLTDG